jgi:hypothetical protein
MTEGVGMFQGTAVVGTVIATPKNLYMFISVFFQAVPVPVRQQIEGMPPTSLYKKKSGKTTTFQIAKKFANTFCWQP